MTNYKFLVIEETPKLISGLEKLINSFGGNFFRANGPYTNKSKIYEFSLDSQKNLDELTIQVFENILFSDYFCEVPRDGLILITPINFRPELKQKKTTKGYLEVTVDEKTEEFFEIFLNLKNRSYLKCDNRFFVYQKENEDSAKFKRSLNEWEIYNGILKEQGKISSDYRFFTSTSGKLRMVNMDKGNSVGNSPN